MTRGKPTTKETVAEIRRMRANGTSVKDISKELDVPLRTVYGILSNRLSKKGSGRRRGRPSCSPRVVRRVFAETRKHPHLGAFRISDSLGFRPCPSTVWAILRRASWHRFRAKRQQRLLQRHLVARRKFGAWFFRNQTDIPSVIWADEKKFWMDGPDTYGSRWSQSKPTHLGLVDSFGRRGVLIHMAFSGDGLVIATRIHGIIDGKRYAHIIEHCVLPVIRGVYGPNFVFQQDNAPVHTSKQAKKMFERNKVQLMKWPPLSPDLNPVENLFGILSQMVYKGGRQYYSEQKLWQAIKQAGSKVPPETLANLMQSVPDWVTQMIHAGGGRFQK